MIKFEFTLEDNEIEILLDVLNTEIDTMTSEAKHSNIKAEYLGTTTAHRPLFAALLYEHHALLLEMIKQKMIDGQTRAQSQSEP